MITGQEERYKNEKGTVFALHNAYLAWALLFSSVKQGKCED